MPTCAEAGQRFDFFVQNSYPSVIANISVNYGVDAIHAIFAFLPF